MINKNTFNNYNLKRIKQKLRHTLFGMQFVDGLFYKVILYTMLISLGFVFLYPIFYMIITSLKTDDDIMNSAIKWIPNIITFDNFNEVFVRMNLKSSDESIFKIFLNFNNSFYKSIYVAGFPAIMTTLSTSLVAYGFSRFKFPLKNFWFILMLASFIITPQILTIPRYVWFKDLNLLGSIFTYVIPASFAQGLNSSLFILIFWSMFNMIPKSLEEAAKIDGASNLKIFTSIAFPLSIPGYIITFLFSFVWYWNEVNMASLYLTKASLVTMPMALKKYISYLDGRALSEFQVILDRPEKMAGVLTIMLPLLILYFVLQRYFVESVDRSGITGE